MLDPDDDEVAGTGVLQAVGRPHRDVDGVVEGGEAAPRSVLVRGRPTNLPPGDRAAVTRTAGLEP